jgi:rfaE bifunctional protein nucleotidyltransferase chain/domain
MKPEWLQKKLIEPADIEEKTRDLRLQGKTIATLNGSFDLLHTGHLFMIHEASKQADFLIVALNSDPSVRKYKSKNRPIIALKGRLEMVAALEFVDFVTWFDEADPRELLSRIRPDVHVNGEEYGVRCIEAEVIEAHGGKLHLVKRIEGLSTSAIVERIKACVE